MPALVNGALGIAEAADVSHLFLSWTTRLIKTQRVRFNKNIATSLSEKVTTIIHEVLKDPATESRSPQWKGALEQFKRLVHENITQGIISPCQSLVW